MYTAKQNFKVTYSAARKAVAGQQVRVARVWADGRCYFDITSNLDFRSVPGTINALQDVLQVIGAKHAPSAQADLSTRLAKYKSAKQWIGCTSEADDDYIDD